MYNTTLLNSVAECTALLNMASAEQADLMFRKTSMEQRAASYAGNAAEICAELAETQAELSSVMTMIATLPEGEKKRKLEKEQKRLEYRIFILNYRKKDVGSIAALDSELEAAKVNKALEAIAAFVTEVENRKAQL